MVKLYDIPRIGPFLRERKSKKLFDSLVEGEVAIDCGANVGKVTKRMIKTGVKVYAFEPDPAAFEILVKNFGGVKDVYLLNKAVSDHSGTAKIYFNNKYNEDPEKWSVASTLMIDKPHINKSNFSVCEVIDLADFISKIEEPIGVLKMDIEGEEVKVLNKMIDLKLTKKIRKIIVETHERFPTLIQSTNDLKIKIRKLGIKNIDLSWA